jgi:hypothetical protein
MHSGAWVWTPKEAQPTRIFITVATATVGLLAGCAASTKTAYTPDGRVGHSLDCGGGYSSWGSCYEKAGELCGAAGYDVMNQAGDSGVVFARGMGSSKQTHNMLIACKRPVPAA